MNKQFFKILIATLILLVGIGAVNALESNSTDNLMSSEQHNIISISDNASEVLSVENENNVVDVNKYDCGEVLSVENENDVVSSDNSSELIAANDNTSEILSVECNDGELVAACDNSCEVLSVENNEEVLSVSNENNNDLLAKNYPYYDSYGNYLISKSQTKKAVYFGKLTFPKKYKKFVSGYKPSKKNKKAWKKYKAFQKIVKKQLKEYSKSFKKVYSKWSKKHWIFYSLDPIFKIKYSKKYMTIKVYYGAYRTYTRNLSTGEGWWEKI